MKKSRLLGVVCACVLALMATTTNAAVLPLEGRLPTTPGGTDFQAYFDPNLGITWAADAALTWEGTWYDQTAWAFGLMLGGVSGWRLPSLDEMAALWASGINVVTPEPFNIPFTPNTAYYYWSSTEVDATHAYDFEFNNGFSSVEIKDFEANHAWAVQSGDVGAVPLPAAAWLFGSGLLGLIGIAGKKST